MHLTVRTLLVSGLLLAFFVPGVVVLRSEDAPPVPAQTPPAPTPLPPEKIAELVKNLSSDDFKLRSDSEVALRNAGPEVVPELEKAAQSNDLEVKSRANRLLAGARAAPILDKIAAVFSNVPSMESDIEIKMFMRGSELSMKGHLRTLTDGKKFSMDLALKQQNMEMLSKATGDGTYMWNEVSMKDPNGGPPVPRMVQKSPLSMVEKFGGDGQTNPIQSMKNFRDKYYFTSYAEGKLGEMDCYILEGRLRAEALERRLKAIQDFGGKEAADSARMQFSQMSRTRLYVNKQDLIVYRNEMIDDGGNTLMQLDLQNVKLGVTFDPALFQYSPAPGIQVMDLEQMLKDRQRMNRMQQAMKDDDPPVQAPPPPPPAPKAEAPKSSEPEKEKPPVPGK